MPQHGFFNSNVSEIWPTEKQASDSPVKLVLQKK